MAKRKPIRHRKVKQRHATRPRKARRLLFEQLEDRRLLAVFASDAYVDLLWPVGSNDAHTRSNHTPNVHAIDINQDSGGGESDFGAAVFASHDGTADLFELIGGYGRHVKVRSTQGFMTVYAHLCRKAAAVR